MGGLPVVGNAGCGCGSTENMCHLPTRCIEAWDRRQTEGHLQHQRLEHDHRGDHVAAAEPGARQCQGVHPDDGSPQQSQTIMRGKPLSLRRKPACESWVQAARPEQQLAKDTPLNFLSRSNLITLTCLQAWPYVDLCAHVGRAGRFAARPLPWPRSTRLCCRVCSVASASRRRPTRRMFSACKTQIGRAHV